MNSPVNGSRSTREIILAPDSVDADSRTINLAFSSETPVLRSYGWEVLDHAAGSVDLGRLNSSAALLVNHDPNQQVGVVESARIDSDNVGRALVRFGKSAFASEILEDCRDEIRTKVSFGYTIDEVVKDGTLDGQPVYRVTKFTPTEISVVAVPADNSVGVGRSDSSDGVADLIANIIIAVADKSEDEAVPDTETIADETADVDDTETRSEKATPLETAQTTGDARARTVSLPSKDFSTVTDNIDNNKAAVTAERERTKIISAMASRLDCAELATRAIDDGLSVEDFVKEFNAKTPETRALKVAETPMVGLSEKEVRAYSFMNAIRTQMDPSNAAFAKAAAFEREVSQAVASKTGIPGTGGFMVPYDVMSGSRTLTVGTAANGGNTVQNELHGELFVNMFRNKLAVAKLGAQFIGGLNGNFAIPRQNGASTTAWISEAAAATTSNLSFDQVTMTPKSVSSWVDYSRLLLLQSSVDLENVVRSDIAAQIAIAVDLAATSGLGSGGQPLGILGTSGIGSVVGGTNGIAPLFNHIVSLETAVAVGNADVDKMGYLVNAKSRGYLKSTARLGNTSGMPIFDLDGSMNGYQTAVSNQITSTGTKGTSSGVTSTILFGNFADLIIGMWGALELKIDPYANSTTGSVRVIGIQSVDVGVRHAASFAAMTDALCG